MVIVIIVVVKEKEKQETIAVMAILEATNKSAGRIKPDAPKPQKGQYIARCIEIDEEYGVTRKKYQSEETEVVNLIHFYFGFKNKAGEAFVIKTKGYKISGSPKSALVEFITSWVGEKPSNKFDTETLRGCSAQITVALETSQGGKTYANIAGISPVMDGMEGLIPSESTFKGLLLPKEQKEIDLDTADEVPF